MDQEVQASIVPVKTCAHSIWKRVGIDAANAGGRQQQQAGEAWRAEDCNNKSWELTGGFLSWFVYLDTIVISTHSVWETGEAKCFLLSWDS